MILLFQIENDYFYKKKIPPMNTRDEFRIFIVEDDAMYAQILAYRLSLNPDYTVEIFSTGKDCLDNLYKKPSVITLDYTLPDMGGKAVLKKIKQSQPEIPVIIISGQEDITTAIELLKEGAYDYIVKGEDTNDRLWNALRILRNNLSLKQENEFLKEEVGKKYDFSNVLIGQSPGIKKLYSLMEKALDNNATVTISGETGTGKELVAKAIHYNSTRKKGPMVSINMGAIPKDLVESELFGYEKGAFTGAVTRMAGKFEQANKGTIFLDEIAELDLNIQTKLLRVLQEREVVRVGGTAPVPVDIRVITATHKNLADEASMGRFRKDLYYRLIGLPIHLPPLRERGNDILVLAGYFADIFCKENKKPRITLSEGARNKLMKYDYPGNVRELKSVVDLAIIMSDGKIILDTDIIFNSIEPARELLIEEMTLEQYDKKIVEHFMQKYDQNAILVAKKLGISKATIYRMLKKYQISK